MIINNDSSLTLEQIADAIEKNGFQQVKGDYEKPVSTLIGSEYGFCAIGMGAHNLGVNAGFLEKHLDDIASVPNDTKGYIYSEEAYLPLGTYIVYLNDGREWTFKQIADWLREFAKNRETANV